MRRLAALLIVTVAMLVTIGGAASASPPSNDDINSATAITELPMHDVVDLSQATWDYAVDSSQCSGLDHSVWYSFTPANDVRVAFDPSASYQQPIAIDVFTGTPDALSFVGCGQGWYWNTSGYILDATAGTTYWIMASPICCAPQPILDLHVYPAHAPQATFTVQAGTVDQGGNVAITGTIDCVGIAPVGARISGDVRQAVGRLDSVTATFDTTAPCSGHQTWTALAQPEAGRFVGGPATINANASACNAVGCSAYLSTTTVLRFRG
jgi:hypothetical protein